MGGLMHVQLKLCFYDLWSLVAADGGSEGDLLHRMNEEYKALGALQS